MQRAASASITILVIALSAGITGLGGCASSYHDRISDVRGSYGSDRLDLAARSINQGIEKNPKNADVLKLDRSIIELLSGHPDRAERTLREVRDRFDYLKQKSAAESVMSMMSDDNRLAYAGEDYERILIRVMLALSNLMDGGDDVTAYSLQIADIQNRILRPTAGPNGTNAASDISRLAIGPYLRAALIEETFMNRDDVLRDRMKVCSWQPDFRYAREDLARAQNGIHSRRGNGVLYIFGMVGHGPKKVETTEIPTSVALLIADRILSETGKHTLPPTIAPIVVPRIVLSTRHVDHLAVSVDGNIAGRTSTIADIGLLARTRSDASRDRTVARAVVRRIVKKGTILAMKEATSGTKYSVTSILFDVAGVLWEATERADTRNWGLLPDRIQVVRLELPVGQHRIGLRAVETSGNLGPEFIEEVDILDGRNTYMLASFPDRIKVGKILTSRSPVPPPQQPAVRLVGGPNTIIAEDRRNQTTPNPGNRLR